MTKLVLYKRGNHSSVEGLKSTQKELTQQVKNNFKISD